MQQGTFVVKNAGSAAIKIHILAVATDEEVGSPICEKKSKHLITEHSSENWRGKSDFLQYVTCS